MKPKYDYGEEVNYKHLDENGRPVCDSCAVVGITIVETDDQSRYFRYPVGTTLYTVEFGDGSDKLIAEDELHLPPASGDSL
jgi:hypothetical protein